MDGDEGFKYQLAQKDKAYQDLETSIQASKDYDELDNLLESEIEKYTEDLNLSTEDFKYLYRSKFNRNLQKHEDGVRLFEGDKLLQGAYKENLTLENDIKTVIESYLKKPEGGKAGSEGGTGGKITMEQFEKAYKNGNPNGTDRDYQQALTNAIMDDKIEQI